MADFKKILISFFISFGLGLALVNLSKAANSSKYVTCNSVIKLMNVDNKVRLHSHDIKYGSGSGQQSVTGTEAKEDVNSYWVVKARTKEWCARGKPIKCGDTIRLEHLSTKKNLHSHLMSSPLSGKQEVSAYGDGEGDGDSGDHWTVVCYSEFWQRNDQVMFSHVDTEVFLSVSGRTYGSPINGQMEVVGDYSSSGHVQWKAMEGIFVIPTDLRSQHSKHNQDHDEL